jgi:hypothetical protein
MKKVQIISLGAFVFVLVILGSIYIQLGGNQEVSISQTHTPTYYLVGKKYEGKRSKKAVKNLMDEIADLVKTKQVNGIFAVYHFMNPDSEQDTLNAFVGVILADTLSKVPVGLESQRIPASEAVRATVGSHWLVSPNPAEVSEKIKAFAKKKQLSLSEKVLEKYNQDKEIITEIAIQY